MHGARSVRRISQLDGSRLVMGVTRNTGSPRASPYGAVDRETTVAYERTLQHSDLTCLPELRTSGCQAAAR
jgi:hypothetical protein